MGNDTFRRWAIQSGTSLSVFFKPGEDRCGIYILEFADGQRYVGQSRDVVRRFADHCRHYGDIVAVQFQTVDQRDLDAAERQMVQNQRDAGHRLRNIDLVSQSWADSVLDAVIDRDVQANWADGEPQVHPDDQRMLIAKRRQATRAKYEQLAQVPAAGEVFADLVTYVSRVIPWPSTTDGRFWTISAMPSTNRTRDGRRLVTVNCGRVETFVVFEDRQSHEAAWFLNVEHGVARRRDLPRDVRSRFFTDDGYRTAGIVDRIDGGAAGSLAAWFDETPALERAARQLALNLMRKGPSLFARFHCDDLVDEVLLAIEEDAATGAGGGDGVDVAAE